MDDEKVRRQKLVVPVKDPEPRTPLQELPAVEEPRKSPSWRKANSTRAQPEPEIAELFADGRCGQAIPDFPATTDGRPTGGRGRRSGQRALRVGERGAPRTDGGGRGKVGRGGVGGQFVFPSGDAFFYTLSLLQASQGGWRAGGLNLTAAAQRYTPIHP